ncbi:MAG: 7-carboxy-7-deazaguanine synthase QueE [Zoogloea sp.]|jgi:7-carboxy-7-deazaguanine synthase|uniref:7-carboxy-7-deazaguanine synthase QueE n=1 Tax=Zoogloea sp. TaxID=49181 RepID=UPI001B3E6E86|nr:7-carboxy-7-deazaguanine synthase QueE [Zoogloea sp.]MBP8265505.1 7-carboxy-7-deazaguanine synthase QueE [Zoogloea sp.]HQA09207.1 7-carboxy-7-deazaguanine synthase QueE [Zoogloea sp.]
MPPSDRPVTLRITEIFHSLQGETSRAGLPTVFVRLTGCPLRCTWCDTEYAFTGGTARSLDDVLAEVASHRCPTVCVTGGEPLSQKNCLPLLTALCDAGYSVSLETSGALDIGDVDPRVSRIVDLKAPGSGEEARNLSSNIPLLTPHDELKLVLAGEADYAWAKARIAEYRLTDRCPVLLAPVQGQLNPADLAAWILRDKLPVRMQVQLHKVIWGNEPGR